MSGALASGDDRSEGDDDTGFVRATSTTGSLALTWEPFDAAELHVWILLVDPASPAARALVAGGAAALLAELVRVPSEARAGAAVVYVPVERRVGVLLVARDEAARPLPPPRFEVRSGPPVARVAKAEPSPAPAPASLPDEVPASPPREVLGTGAKGGRAIPLVFAKARGALPDLAAMARGIAQRVGAARPELARPELLRANVAPPEPPRATGPAGFGVRQRWTLTRLGFAPATGEAPRVAIVRTQFIGADLVARWAEAPPGDAYALPSHADGLVDALTPDEVMAFYVILERAPGGAWRPLTLATVPPPFSASRHPFVLGDARARLAPLAAVPPQSEAHASLVAAALRGLVEDT